MIVFSFLFLMLSSAAEAGVKETMQKKKKEAETTVGCLCGTLGRAYHLWSARTYDGYKNNCT